MTDDVDVFKFLGVNHNKATEEALRHLDILEVGSRRSSSTVGGKKSAANTPVPGGGGGRQQRTKEGASSHHAAARRARRESDSKKSLNFTKRILDFTQVHDLTREQTNDQ